MFLSTALVSFLPLASTYAASPPQQYIFSNPPIHDEEGYRIPSIHESAIMARRILHLSTLGTLVTSFPTTTHSSSSSDDFDTQERRPPGVENNPIGLMEYYADCEADGNPTVLAIDIATPYRNYHAGSNVSLAVRWWPKQSLNYSSPSTSSSSDDDDDDEDIPTPPTPAALPRFSLHGYLERIPATTLLSRAIPVCFLRAHPDSVLWQPGNDISHESEYMRFVVEHVYWFGGFGDRARIGWLPIEEWRNVTMDEVVACLLPGEEGYKEGAKCGL